LFPGIGLFPGIAQIHNETFFGTQVLARIQIFMLGPNAKEGPPIAVFDGLRLKQRLLHNVP